jgi:hypothetical protein
MGGLHGSVLSWACPDRVSEPQLHSPPPSRTASNRTGDDLDCKGSQLLVQIATSLNDQRLKRVKA